MAIFLATLFIVICILLVIVVLLQKGRGGGLGAAFGGAGSSAFGTRTGDVFTWVTIVLTALFLLMAVAVTLVFRPPVSVLAPVFQPPGMPIREGIVVTIVNRTRGAKVYYTNDGRDPTLQSRMVTDQFIKVEPGMTLKARAVIGDVWSDIVAETYPKAEAQTRTAPASGPATTGAATTSAPAETAPAPARPATTVPASVPATGGAD